MSVEGGVVLDVRQSGLCYLFMGGREDYVSSLRKEVLYWMGDREDYATCVVLDGR